MALVFADRVKVRSNSTGTELPTTVTDYSWQVFYNSTVAPATISMAIFANGAWCLNGGYTD